MPITNDSNVARSNIDATNRANSDAVNNLTTAGENLIGTEISSENGDLAASNADEILDVANRISGGLLGRGGNGGPGVTE